MIDKVLEIIRDEIQVFFNKKVSVSIGDRKIKLAPADGSAGSENTIENAVSMTVIRIENDRENMSNGGGRRAGQNSNVLILNQPVRLNVYVLFAAHFKDYIESLKFISYVIAFFQTKSLFNQENTPNLPDYQQDIKVHLIDQNVEELNRIWGMIGGDFSPCVLYRLRSVTVDEREIQATGAVAGDTDLEMGHSGELS